MNSSTIAVIGTGAMGNALARGLVDSGFCSGSDIVACDIDSERLQSLVAAIQCQQATSASEAVEKSDVVILAVKPAAIGAVLEDIAPRVSAGKLLVSIAAGVKTAAMEAALPEGTPVVRVMPNTPAMVGAGASAVASGAYATDQHLQYVLEMFAAMGEAAAVDEKLMDAVTGLSGSGPAFVYTVIEALADAGVSQGLVRATALLLAAQTVLGAAKMVLETATHPAVLRDQVTSPGGTTIAGCAELERAGLRAALINAVQAAAERSAELSR